jgi:hypothetical protein
MRGTPQLGSAASAPAQNNRISCILSKKLPKQKKKRRKQVHENFHT